MAGLLSMFSRKRKGVRCAAVIVAAGSARRMGRIDKIMAMLGELPVLVHTVSAFQECAMISEIVIVTREDLIPAIGELCRQYHLDKVRKVIVGGSERSHSVRKGIQEIPEDTDLIAIHDGARPLVTQDILEATIREAGRTGAAAPAIPVIDTIKRAEGELAVDTVERSALRAVQTPQIFEGGLIRAALEKAEEEGAVLTDDCSAVERLGMRVTLTEGSRENIKITTPFDLMLGEAILEARAKGEL